MSYNQKISRRTFFKGTAATLLASSAVFSQTCVIPKSEFIVKGIVEKNIIPDYLMHLKIDGVSFLIALNKKNSRISMYDTSEFKGLLKHPEVFQGQGYGSNKINYPSGLSFDGRELLVADTNNHRIIGLKGLCIGPDDEFDFREVTSANDDKPYKFYFPSGIAYCSYENFLFITEKGRKTLTALNLQNGTLYRTKSILIGRGAKIHIIGEVAQNNLNAVKPVKSFLLLVAEENPSCIRFAVADFFKTPDEVKVEFRLSDKILTDRKGDGIGSIAGFALDTKLENGLTVNNFWVASKKGIHLFNESGYELDFCEYSKIRGFYSEKPSSFASDGKSTFYFGFSGLERIIQVEKV